MKRTERFAAVKKLSRRELFQQDRHPTKSNRKHRSLVVIIWSILKQKAEQQSLSSKGELIFYFFSCIVLMIFSLYAFLEHRIILIYVFYLFIILLYLQIRQ